MTNVADGLAEGVKNELRDWFGGRAAAVDRGEISAHDGLLYVAEQGLLAKGVSPGLGGDGGDLADMIEVIATVAERCLTSAFVLWSHRSLIALIAAADNTFLQRHVLPDLLHVTKFGATGLADAVKHAADVEQMRMAAEPIDRGDYIVNGHIPWASNLVAHRFVVAVAAKSPENKMMLGAVSGTAQGIVRNMAPSLLAMDGSASGGLRFNDVRVEARRVISRDGAVFLADVRPRFFLLQCGLPLGVATAALRAAAAEMTKGKASLVPRLERLQTNLARLVRDTHALSRRGTFDKRDFYDVCRVRKQLTDVAVDAVWLELEATGGAGYRADGDTARRLREAAFLPLQSPTLTQLRELLAVLEKKLPTE